jgi:shikimate dehydrogenase
MALQNPSPPDRYAVIGNPIAHSLSPTIYGEFARAEGQDIEYGKILGPLGAFARTVDAFRASGGRGINVTLPFKLEAHAYAGERSARAELAGAVNALKFDGKRILGENFDGVGLVRDVVHNLGVPLVGKRVLMLGAGGAARGALLPFLAEGPTELVIANIEEGVARTLADIGSRHAGAGTVVQSADYRALVGTRFDVVINATSASLGGELPPVPVTVFRQCQLAYDLAYGLGLTPFLRLARNAGVAQVADGVGMLAEQAAEAFAWWRGVRPHTAAVIEQLRVPLQ